MSRTERSSSVLGLLFLEYCQSHQSIRISVVLILLPNLVVDVGTARAAFASDKVMGVDCRCSRFLVG